MLFGFERIAHLILRQFDISLLYENKYGVKCFNQLLTSDSFIFYSTGDDFELPCGKLFICFDGLKDVHTLLNTCVLSSPHLDLVRCIDFDNDLEFSSYVQRDAKGLLDFRLSRKITKNYLMNLRNKFSEKKTAILENCYDPIKVVKVFDRYYIADGKHTAATCALLNVSVKCVDCSLLIFDSFFWWIQKKMLKNKEQYTKHLEFFNLVMEHYKIEDYNL